MATLFAVKAAAGKKGFSCSLLSEKPLVLRVEIPAEPARGEANRALLSGLERMLGCSVRLIAGRRSRRKTLAAECSAEWIVGRARSEG